MAQYNYYQPHFTPEQVFSLTLMIRNLHSVAYDPTYDIKFTSLVPDAKSTDKPFLLSRTLEKKLRGYLRRMDPAPYEWLLAFPTHEDEPLVKEWQERLKFRQWEAYREEMRKKGIDVDAVLLEEKRKKDLAAEVLTKAPDSQTMVANIV